jgi:hypothetical protein
MTRCQSCTKNQYPNFVLVYIIDEDGQQTGVEREFQYQTNNYFAVDGEAEINTSGITRQIANYINDLGFHEGSFGGFLGIVLVPVYTDVYPYHYPLKYRMEVFRDTISEEYRDKVIILGEESDPSGVAQINREDDYSERLITAIETIRQSYNQDDQEELIDLHYIINLIDGSGSHQVRHVDATWSNYFTYFTPPLEDGTNPAVDLFNSLTVAGNEPPLYETTIVQSLQRNRTYYDPGSNWKTGLGEGIGTRHVIEEVSERWPATIMRTLHYLAAQQNNNWIENCRKMCNHRWTTDVGHYYPYNEDTDANGGNGIDWDEISPETAGVSLDVYGILYNKRENSDEPEDYRFDMRANFPSGGGFPYISANDYETVGNTAGAAFRAGFEESPFKDAIYNTNRFRSNCPCYMFDPVRNYITENLRDMR